MNLISRGNLQLLAWYRFLFFSYHSGVCNEDIAILDSTMVLVFDNILFSMPLSSIYHAKTFIPIQSCPNLNVIENGVDPNNITRIQRCCNLDISTKYHHLSGTTNLILAIKTSIPLLMLIPCIKTHTTIHHTNTGVYSN